MKYKISFKLLPNVSDSNNYFLSIQGLPLWVNGFYFQSIAGMHFLSKVLRKWKIKWLACCGRIEYDLWPFEGLLIFPVPCISIIIGPTSLGCEDSWYEIMCPEYFGGSALTFDTLRSNGVIDTLIPVSTLLFLLEIWDVKTTSRESCPESFCEVRFDLPVKVKLALATFNPFPILPLVFWNSKHKASWHRAHLRVVIACF